VPPVEAKNIGRIRAWKLGPRTLFQRNAGAGLVAP
jgi:hypothetical protein